MLMMIHFFYQQEAIGIQKENVAKIESQLSNLQQENETLRLELETSKVAIEESKKSYQELQESLEQSVSTANNASQELDSCKKALEENILILNSEKLTSKATIEELQVSQT